jgi:sugar phosphate isomerase/epimerase
MSGYSPRVRKVASETAADKRERPLATEPREPGSPEGPSMQIGVLLGTFAAATLEARLDAVRACGLECVQLSMGTAGLPAMPDRIAPELVIRARREAAARGITMASVQGTFNMSHPDAVSRLPGPAESARSVMCQTATASWNAA